MKLIINKTKATTTGNALTEVKKVDIDGKNIQQMNMLPAIRYLGVTLDEVKTQEEEISQMIEKNNEFVFYKV